MFCLVITLLILISAFNLKFERALAIAGNIWY